MKLVPSPIYWAVIVLLSFSCVPRKKLIYLQENVNSPIKAFQAKDETYRLKPRDVISVNIFSLTPGEFDIFAGSGNSGGESSGTVNLFTINDQGYVELPAIGNVPVSGLTLEEAEDKVKELLQDYLRSPLVRISLQTPFEFTVLGEVNRPGRFNLVGEELTLLEALGTAGDLTTFADRAHIKIVRKNEAGDTQIEYVNVLNDHVLTSQYFYLRSDDVIIVDPLKARTTRENQLFFFSSIIGTLSTLTFLLLNFSRISR